MNASVDAKAVVQTTIAAGGGGCGGDGCGGLGGNNKRGGGNYRGNNSGSASPNKRGSGYGGNNNNGGHSHKRVRDTRVARGLYCFRCGDAVTVTSSYFVVASERGEYLRVGSACRCS